jgi:hypothetical protein
MSTRLADSQTPWKLSTEERPAGLEIVLLKRSYVLPWSQFLFAEGGDDEIRLAFTTHDILIKGSNLGSLLVDFASQRIARLQQPTRPDRFAKGATTPFFSDLSVVKIESHREDL